MKKITLLLSLIFSATIGFSQITFSDTVVYNSFPKDNLTYSLNDTFRNNSMIVDTLFWKMSSNLILSGWTSIGYCDPLACYTASDTTTHYYAIPPGDSGSINVSMKAAPTALNGASYITITTNYGDMVFKFETAPSSCNANFYIYEDTLAAAHTYIGINTCTGPITNYDWSWGDGSLNSSGPYPSHTYATAGVYNICLTVSDGVSCIDSFCSNQLINKTQADMLSITFSAPTVLNEASNYEAALYPNPANDFLVLKHDINSSYNVDIFSLNGMKIQQNTMHGGDKIDISTLTSGLYFLRVIDKTGQKKYLKFTKL